MGKEKYIPRTDASGNYWFDCDCMINRLMQKRCSLHHAAPDLLAACLKAAITLTSGLPTGVPLDVFHEKIAERLQSAIAKAKGE